MGRREVCHELAGHASERAFSFAGSCAVGSLWIVKPLHDSDWLRIVRPGCRVFIGGGAAVPMALVREMLSRAHLFKDVELVHIHGLGGSPWTQSRYDQVLRTNSFFLTPEVAAAVARGAADYTPCPFSELPSLLSGSLNPDLAMIMVTEPDADGYCSTGVSVDVVMAAVKSARHVIAQINPRMPRTCGDGRISCRKIDRYIQHAEELPELETPLLDKRHERIGRYAAQLVDDGATLQMGLGATPTAVARALRNHRHLGIHSGLFNDELMNLVQCGAVDGSRKNYRPGKIIASHAMGSRRLYRFLDGNPEVEFHPSDWVNSPMRIARNNAMVAVNGAHEIDLTGQVVRDSKGHRFYGGIGAMQDFIRGAGQSKGGRPIIALTATSDDGQESRIVADLRVGSGVCTGRGDVHHVVTEFGVASLHGRSIRERVARLVEIAHPEYRERLLAGARKRGWLPKFFTMPSTDAGAGVNGIESAWVKFGSARFLLRPLHPSDMRALQEFFYSHDEETIRMRYGYQLDRMSGESAYKLAAVDQSRDLALGLFAELPGRQEIRAIGRYYLDPCGKRAEVAFVVHESTRHLGMAGFLLGELAMMGQRRGLEKFWASVLRENRAMTRLFQAAGGSTIDAGDDAEIEFDIPLDHVLKSRREFLRKKHIQWMDR